MNNTHDRQRHFAEEHVRGEKNVRDESQPTVLIHLVISPPGHADIQNRRLN